MIYLLKVCFSAQPAGLLQAYYMQFYMKCAAKYGGSKFFLRSPRVDPQPQERGNVPALRCCSSDKQCFTFSSAMFCFDFNQSMPIALQHATHRVLPMSCTVPTVS